MRGIRNKVIQAYIKFRFPGCRIDWVSPDLAVLTGVNGLRCWVILDKRKTWSWMDFAQWLVPAVICLWSAIVVSGVMLGCMYGAIY